MNREGQTYVGSDLHALPLARGCVVVIIKSVPWSKVADNWEHTAHVILCPIKPDQEGKIVTLDERLLERDGIALDVSSLELDGWSRV